MKNTEAVKILTSFDTRTQRKEYVSQREGGEDLLAEVSRITSPEEFPEMGLDEVGEILSTTIKHDEANKKLMFLSMLSVYTEADQMNVSLQAPSAFGKTYLAQEVSKYFPADDVVILGHITPKAFFYDAEKNEETGRMEKDLSGKIILFLDQPHHQVLEHLRPLLSHDEKEITVQMTNKNKGGANRTQTIVVIGFPMVVYASASAEIDEQESTRFLVVSPEMHEEKLLATIKQTISNSADPEKHSDRIANDPKRKKLMERVEAIKWENIEKIKTPNKKLIEKRFLTDRGLKARDQRDITKILTLIKAHALLNCWHRERKQLTDVDPVEITANDDDVNAVFDLWQLVGEAQNLNLSPYQYEVYEKVFLPAYKERQNHQGATVNEIMAHYKGFYGTGIDARKLRIEILAAFSKSGLIGEDTHPTDGRKKLFYSLDNPPTDETDEDFSINV
jgi:hypothetical protein